MHDSDYPFAYFLIRNLPRDISTDRSARAKLFLMTLGDCAEALWRIPNNEEEQIRRDDLAAEMSELIDTSMGFIEGDQSAATKFLYHYCAIGWMCGPKPDEPDAENALAAYKPLDTLVRFAYYLYVAENLPKSNAGMRRANAESAAALRQGWGVQTNFEWALMLRTILEFYRFGLSEFWTSVKDTFDKKESRILFDPIGILQNMERFRVPPDEAEYTGMFHEIAGRSDNTEFYMIWREYLRCRVAEQIRKTQLDILSYIRGVCEQNGLPCFLAYETLYDALYPGKLDRVPVQATMMAPVSTIDALERLLSADKTCRFELLSRRFDDHCWFTGLRVISKNVKADMKADRPYYSRNHGVYAEIIPYVPVPPRKEFKTTIRYRTAQLTEWEIRQRIAGRRYLTKLPERLFSASCRPRSLHELVRKMDALRTIPVQNATQTRIMGYRFKQDHREVIPGSWLEKVDSIEYFGNHYSVPGSSAELLARLYPSADAGFEISGEPGNRFADNGPDSLLVIPKETRLIEGSLPKRGPRIKKVMRSGLSLLKEVSRPARRTAADMATRAAGNLRTAGLVFSGEKKEIAKYVNLEPNKRCFLIGNGPSLTGEDLDLLKDEITLGCNLIYKFYEQTVWRPSYYCVADSTIMRTHSQDVLDNIGDSKLVVREFAWRYMATRPWDALKLPYLNSENYRVRGNVLAYHYLPSATVMTMMVEFAITLGCRELYLVGVDATDSAHQGAHAVRDYYDEKIQKFTESLKRRGIVDVHSEERMNELRDKSMDAYRKLRRYAERRGIRICNATRGGQLEIFERASLEDILKN